MNQEEGLLRQHDITRYVRHLPHFGTSFSTSLAVLLSFKLPGLGLDQMIVAEGPLPVITSPCDLDRPSNAF